MDELEPSPMTDLASLRTVDDLRAALVAHGARPHQVRPVLRHWLAGRPVDTPLAPRKPRRARRLEAFLRDELAPWLDGLLVELAAEGDDHGGRRLVHRLRDGRTLETVELPRAGVCVSTQVGCAVGCTFCKTGESGLLRQLTSLEILAQVARVRARRSVRRVVLMGMGEPMHNLHAALDAIGALGREGELPHENLVFSTVGDPSVFDRLAAEVVRPTLALSLHTLDAERRSRLLPRAPRHDPERLLDAALAYGDRIGRPTMVQWTLLRDVNDSLEEAHRLARRLAGRRVLVNYIPFNAVDGSGFERPGVRRCVELVRALRANGVVATLRFSAATEVDGGCGQLRARVAPSTDPMPEVAVRTARTANRADGV